MSRESINVTVDVDGSVTIEAMGFKGKACSKATEFIERGLGKVKDKRHKREYFEQATAVNRLEAR